jgi:cytochrome c
MRFNYLVAAAIALGLCASCGESKPAEEAAAAPAVPTPTLADLPAPWNAADLENGASLFVKCKSCHTVGAGEAGRVGPNLHGVFDREPASAPKFKYSPALEAFAEDRWTPELIDQWLSKPKAFLPGNAMFFDGLANEDDRRDLIGWLLIETRK